jgi:hypothetical protein
MNLRTQVEAINDAGILEQPARREQVNVAVCRADSRGIWASFAAPPA